MGLLLVIMLLCVNFLPLLAGNAAPKNPELVQNGNGGAASWFSGTLYLLDESNLSPKPDYGKFFAGKVNVVNIKENELDKVSEEVKVSDKAEMIAVIENKEKYFSITMFRPLSTKILGSTECTFVSSLISQVLNDAKLTAAGVKPEQLSSAQKYIISQTAVAGEQPESEIVTGLKSTIPTIVSVILFMFIFTYGVFVAQSVASEKTSRVMEYLLTSVRPLAIITGKVLAMGLASLTQFVYMAVLSGGLVFIIAPMGTLGILSKNTATSASAALQIPAGADIQAELAKTFGGIGIGSIVCIVLLFILGFLFYSTLFGLVGSCVNRSEDLQSAIQPVTLIGVLGFYLSYIPRIIDASSRADKMNVLTVLSYYLPISSPFSLPSAIIMGEISPLHIAFAIFILVIINILTIMFVAKVYEAVILYTGNTLKIKDLVKISKQGA
jgi:ABC-2 type transport system permease protein